MYSHSVLEIKKNIYQVVVLLLVHFRADIILRVITNNVPFRVLFTAVSVFDVSLMLWVNLSCGVRLTC